MKHLLLAASLMLLTPALASAQSPTEPRMSDFQGGAVAGSQEITLSGSGSNDNEFENGSFGLTGSYGRFLTDGLEVSLRQTFNWIGVRGGEDSMNGTTRVAADYHFNPGSRWRPFVGANIGYTYGDGVNETGLIGPEAGLKYFVNPTTFILVQSEYQYFFESSDDITDNFDDGAFVHTVGMGFLF